MNWSNILTNATKNFKYHAPEIMTALGAAGVITTAYLAGKASVQAVEAIDKEQLRLDSYEKSHPLERKEKLQLVWKLYIPAGVSGAFAIGCIIGASKASGRRTSAAVGAYALTERAFSEYREKVVEQLGKNKEQKVRDELRQDAVTKHPSGSQEVIVVGSGNVLCCELYTHRYFRSDMEALRKAENQLNRLIVNDLYVTLDEFYDLLGLPGTSNSAHVGWNSDRLVDLEFSTVISEAGEPCLAFDYNYIKPIKV